jgi:hypothetical protein
MSRPGQRRHSLGDITLGAIGAAFIFLGVFLAQITRAPGLTGVASVMATMVGTLAMVAGILPGRGQGS